MRLESEVPTEAATVRVDEIGIWAPSGLDGASVCGLPSQAVALSVCPARPRPQPGLDGDHRGEIARHTDLHSATDRDLGARRQGHLLDHARCVHFPVPAEEDRWVRSLPPDVEDGRLETVATAAHEVVTDRDRLLAVDGDHQLAHDTDVGHVKALGPSRSDLTVFI